MYELTDEQRAIRAMAREFARREIAPFAAEWNATHSPNVDVVRKMGEVGLLGMVVPESDGGPGLDNVTLALVTEEIAAADVGTSVSFAVQNGLAIDPLVHHGNDEQRAAWLPRLVAGEVLGAYGLTEPDVGSDVGALRTQAVRDGDEFVVSGSKMWISSGGFADVFILFARTDGPGPKGISAFIAPVGEGLTVSEIDKMGLHSSSTVELAFDGLRIPAANMLGEPGTGMTIALETLDGGRITVAAQACGIARAALELACEYATQRTAFGGPIGRFQGVQFPLADVSAKLEAARALTIAAARVRDRGEPHSLVGAQAKLVASSVAVEAADVAVQTLGGMGYSAEFAAERLYRDAKVTQIYEGTSQIQRLVIARHILGRMA